MPPGDSWFRPFDWWAIGLLAAGCATGITVLLLRPAPVTVPQPAPPAGAGLRVHST